MDRNKGKDKVERVQGLRRSSAANRYSPARTKRQATRKDRVRAAVREWA